ncbi:MAG: aminopeptidase P family protein [bacterium]|nr:aminopeptidase P family protein [bacterium]
MSRLKTCRKIIREKNLEAFLVSDFYNIGYLSGFFPLSPQEREVFLLLTPKECFLLTDGRYINQVKISNTGFTCLAVSAEQNFFQLIASLCQKLKIKSLAFEKESLTFAEYEKLKDKRRVTRVGVPHRTPAALARTSDGGNERQDPPRSYQLIPTQNIVEEKRAIKDAKEVNSIQKACQIADQAFNHLLGFLKPGLTEKEVADEIEWFIRKKGAVDLSFDPIVAFGPNSAFPHHRTSHQRLKTKDLILLDFGAKVENYCSDITRVVFLGKANAEQKKTYQTVLDSQKIAIEFLNSQFIVHDSKGKTVKASEIDSIARSHIISKGYPTIPHSLGHGVGLCEHELPRLSSNSKDVLKPEMVFSVEPGIYLPAEALSKVEGTKASLPGGFGIRIEDLVVLTPSGPQILTQSPKKLIEL